MFIIVVIHFYIVIINARPISNNGFMLNYSHVTWEYLNLNNMNLTTISTTTTSSTQHLYRSRCRKFNCNITTSSPIETNEEDYEIDYDILMYAGFYLLLILVTCILLELTASNIRDIRGERQILTAHIVQIYVSPRPPRIAEVLQSQL
jgi:hypothetical protein